MNILICGAGIAGLTAVYWLQQSGHTCTVIEKAKDIRTEGYMIDFGGSGWDVADRMGLIPALQARQSDVNMLNFMNKHGKVAVGLDAHQLYKIADVDGKFMALNRRDVVMALYEHIKDDTRICFDMTVSDIQQTDDSASVTFSDGSNAEFDLVIGADGIHSQIRRMLFGDETEFAKYLGYHFCIFEIELDLDIPTGFDLYHEPGIQVSAYPVTDKQWMIFITMQADAPTVPPQNQRPTVIKNRLQGMGWVCEQIADAMSDDMYIFYDTITQIVNQSWSQGRVVLIGDAAHCPTLISGQGASMAMTGAYFLAQALDNQSTVSDALVEYDARLRPHIDRIQSKARNFAPNFVPDSHWRITLIQVMMRLIGLPIVKNIVGKQFAVKSVIPAEG